MSDNTYLSAPQILHTHVLPSPVAGVEIVSDGAPCWVCGSPWSRMVLLAEWLTDTFTAHTRARCPASSWVCEPCVWVCARLSPVPGRPPKEGKSAGGNFRNYSHAYDLGDSDDYRNFSKGEKPGLLAWLRAPKDGAWWCAIADSGQKHVLPWAPINPAGALRGSVLFEEQIVLLPGGVPGWTLVDQIASALTAGATKDEVASGDYTARAWQLAEREIATVERHRGARGSAWFSLALWLAQRDEAAVAARRANAEAEHRAKRARRQAHGRDADARAPRVPIGGGQSAQALGSDDGPDASGSAHHCEHPGVDDGAAEVASARGAGQLTLFSDGKAPRSGQ